MKIRNFITVILSVSLISCGQSEQESDMSSEVVITENSQVQGRGEGKDNWYDNLLRSHWDKFELIELPEDQDWFEVYKITDSIYAIYEMGQFEEVISYLILGEKRALLFDTGIGVGDIGTLVAALTDLPVSVLNSHTHYDHVGGNHYFEKIYGTTTKYFHAESEALLRGRALGVK